MYSSGYSQVNSPEAKRKMQYRSKGKSCGYYMRIVFFFSSLIQSLIIVSLVLFLLYGNRQGTSVGDRVQDLEESFSRLSIENVDLKNQRKNLTNLLNVSLTTKAKTEFDLLTLRRATNVSIFLIQDFHKKLQMCSTDLSTYKIKCISGTRIIAPPPFPPECNCGHLVNQMKFVETNFSETVKNMGINMEQIVKEKDKYAMESITLRREKSNLEMELEQYKLKSKEEFSQLLSSVSTVSKALLEKIDSLFPRHIAFQLTCPKQRDHLEQIHTNCTNLSREVEDKLQRYLNNVGEQLSDMQEQNFYLKAENRRLYLDYSECSHNRSAIVEQNRQSSHELQKKHDREKEMLLLDKMKLYREIEVLKSSVTYRISVVADLNQQLKQLNTSCMLKAGIVGGPGPRSGTPSQSGWSGSSSASSSSASTGSGSSNTGSGSSIPASTGGAHSSVGSGSSFSSGGGVLNKPADSGRSSTAQGKTSSGTSYGGTGSSGGGKANGLTSDAGGVNQHIQFLQQLINPSAPQEKQDVFRMLG